MTSDGTQSSSRAALSAVRDLTGLPTVGMELDGLQVVVAFHLDAGEHERRAAAGVGAVTSTAVLHGLWLIPSEIAVPPGNVPLVKRHRLRGAQGFVENSPRGFVRLYSPAGTVHSIGVRRRSAIRAIEQTARFTSIFRRIALTDGNAPPSDCAVERARDAGIGLVAISGDEHQQLVRPARPVLGIPAVYRWWVAELAYASWLQDSTQPVS